MDIERRLRDPVARRLLVIGGIVLLAHGLAAGALGLLQGTHADVVAPGVVVAGQSVGGLSADELDEVVEGRAEGLLSDTVLVTACRDPVVADRREVGVTVETDEAIGEAWDVGRRGFWRALADQIGMRTGREFRVELERHLDTDRLEQWAATTALTVSCEPRPAEVALVVTDDGTRVEPTPGQAGRDVPADLLVEAVDEGFDEPGLLRIDTVSAAVEPPTSEADLRTAVTAAELALSDAVRFDNPAGGDDVELEPADLAAILHVEVDPDAPDGERLPLIADADELRTHLDEDLDAIEVAPTDARPSIVDGSLVIEDDEPGFAMDADATADRLLELAARRSDRTAELPGSAIEAALTRADVQGLGIEEEVSSFSTALVPGEPRNVNIRQAADYLADSLVMPGEQLSLNEAVGRRTAERGFEENGFIRQGELVSVYGGGVSQLATTFMNAAWFAGIEIVEFQPHSLSFARYPIGREATMSWNTIDVVIENDSPHAILVATSHSETEVTVSFWSTPWAEVESWTGEPTNPTQGELRDGFDVSFGRTITYPDGSTEEETYSHRYLPEDAPTDTVAPD
jgi:vancomycin resistance protein YoaR